jgi:hypothetical protein
MGDDMKDYDLIAAPMGCLIVVLTFTALMISDGCKTPAPGPTPTPSTTTTTIPPVTPTTTSTTTTTTQPPVVTNGNVPDFTYARIVQYYNLGRNYDGRMCTPNEFHGLVWGNDDGTLLNREQATNYRYCLRGYFEHDFVHGGTDKEQISCGDNVEGRLAQYVQLVDEAKGIYQVVWHVTTKADLVSSKLMKAEHMSKLELELYEDNKAFNSNPIRR